jgi:hypothetical protein
VSAAPGPDRRIIDAARELAGLSDAAIYARFGAGSVSPVTAYARAISEAQGLLSELAAIVERSGDADARSPVWPDPETQKLAEIRALLEAFDWEFDDRQYALEAIDRIVTRGES